MHRKFNNIDQRKLWEIHNKYVIECKTLRSIYSIRIVFFTMQIANDRIRNNSAKSCARHLIFESKWPVECPLEHDTQNSIVIFPT